MHDGVHFHKALSQFKSSHSCTAAPETNKAMEIEGYMHKLLLQISVGSQLLVQLSYCCSYTCSIGNACQSLVRNWQTAGVSVIVRMTFLYPSWM